MERPRPPATPSVMVTGGAGYIGSHVVRALEDAGHRVVVLDDLSTGRRERIGDRPAAIVDLSTDAAADAVAAFVESEQVRAVVHLAARKSVPESVERPEWYVRQNVGGLANLLAGMRAAGCSTIVYSSSAAVYGDVPARPVSEQDSPAPVSPYGRTKLMGEDLVADAARAWGLRHVSLRYFNVAGARSSDLADGSGLNLVGIALARWAAGQAVEVFGTDYATPDGSCVRDFVHVVDVAEAHVAALEHLDAGGTLAPVLNVGTGRGTSVLELLGALSAARAPLGRIELGPRRAGDPASVVAAVDLIAEQTGWRASRTVAEMCESA